MFSESFQDPSYTKYIPQTPISLSLLSVPLPHSYSGVETSSRNVTEAEGTTTRPLSVFSTEERHGDKWVDGSFSDPTHYGLWGKVESITTHECQIKESLERLKNIVVLPKVEENLFREGRRTGTGCTPPCHGVGTESSLSVVAGRDSGGDCRGPVP